MKKIEECLKDSNINIHDENISGIMVDSDKNLIVHINGDTTDVRVIFVKPKHIRLDNFRLGNTVFGIYIFDGNDIVEIENELYYLLDISKDDSQFQNYFNNIKTEILKGNLLFVSIESSYGVEGFVICESIETK